MRSIADIPRRQAAENPDKPALICHDRTLTYRDLDAESSQVANALIAAGVGSQSRVGFIGKNIAEYFTLVFGAAKINAVTVAVNWRLVAAEMAYILNHAEVELVVVEDEFLDHLGAMDLPRQPLVVLVGAVTATEGQVGYSDWINGQPATDPAYPSVEDDTSLQLYTSGTTGLPKGAELSNRNVFSIVGPISGMLGLHPDSVMLHVLPLFHIGGSGVATVG
ncbi:MAG: AMP-binding protein, partial [Acidimicrobiaceae bacterium]|nr:AMP-binding protein [Acidimicrobiaceae bacterium]